MIYRNVTLLLCFHLQNICKSLSLQKLMIKTTMFVFDFSINLELNVC